ANIYTIGGQLFKQNTTSTLNGSVHASQSTTNYYDNAGNKAISVISGYNEQLHHYNYTEISKYILLDSLKQSEVAIADAFQTHSGKLKGASVFSYDRNNNLIEMD